MAKHVKWANPHFEDDYSVHILKSAEWTLCGLAFEGAGALAGDYSRVDQDFAITPEQVTCEQCIDIVAFCKRIRKSELANP